MGMDGLSMANTGALKESTSADLNNRTEQVVQSNKTSDNDKVQTLATNRHIVHEKEEQDEGKKRNPNQETTEEEFLDGLIEEVQEEEEGFHIEDLENPNKDFYVKLNAKDDIIELYDSSSDRLIETISGNELRELVRKLNMASGIFVNKKV